MCRNIKTLHNFMPPASDEEIHAASIQYVRKISGSQKPSVANRAAFEKAVAAVSTASRELLESLVTTAAPRNREEEARKATLKNAKRFGSVPASNDVFQP